MAEQKEYLRFSVAQRFEHWVLVMSFTLLALTGLPQKFAGDGWAESLIGLLGGIENVRIIHHTAAAVLSLAVIYHVIAVSYKIFVLRVRWTMFPRLDDVFDALDAVRYNLGLTKEQPKFNRYSFAEKAEYWALIWGTVIMAITGFIMWNPINAAHFLSGDMIPTAKAAHGAEAILAVLAVIIWHFYSVHVKTFNKGMFTGKITQHQMQDEHGLELEQISQAKVDVRPSPDIIKKRERIFIPVATVASVLMLVILYLFISYEGTALTTLPRRAQPVQVFVPITPTPTGAAPASAASAVALPADHAGRTTCLACHANAVGPALPADHAGRTDATCSACHKVGGAPAPVGTAAPAGTAAPVGTAAPSTGAAGPKPQPADHAGRVICNACHNNGAGPAEPVDHAGRADATCSACHKAAGTTAPAGTAAPGGTSAPNTSAAAGPKPQPADHAGRVICNACHNNGVGPAEPADHAGRADAVCTGCHTPASAPGAQPTSAPATKAPNATDTPTSAPPAKAIIAQSTGAPATSTGISPAPADHAGRTTCLSCHASLQQPAMPTDHAGRMDTSCTACHALSGSQGQTIKSSNASTGPNPEPADHVGRPVCTACHPLLQDVRMPANHAGRTQCSNCHWNLMPVPVDHAGRSDPATCAVCHKAP